jgi:predicted MFS family arabinose efflux permease
VYGQSAVVEQSDEKRSTPKAFSAGWRFIIMRKMLMVLALAVGAFSTALNAMILGPTLKDIATYFNVSDARAGQLGTLHAMIAASVAFLAAPLVDRYGPKRVLRFECAVLFAGTTLSALAPSFLLLVVGRAVAGIGGAIITATCIVAVSQIFDDSVQRNRGVGLVASAANAASALGLPVLVIVTEQVSWRWAFAILAIPLVVALAATWGLPSAQTTESNIPLREDYQARFRLVAQSPRTMLLLLTIGTGFVVLGGTTIYAGAYIKTVFSAGSGSISLFFLTVGVSSVVASNLVPRLTERVSAGVVLCGSAALAVANLLAVGFIYTSVGSMIVFAVLLSFGLMGFLLTTVFMVLDSLPAATGTVMSLQSAIMEVGVAIGAAVGGGSLSVFNSYPAMYHIFGLIVLVALMFGMVGIRASKPTVLPDDVIAVQTS